MSDKRIVGCAATAMYKAAVHRATFCVLTTPTSTRFVTPRPPKDMQLVWKATVSRAPVAVAVANFGGLPGLVCSLDDAGVLSACYQGTDPPTSAVVAPDTKEIDYDHINQEHRKLLQASVCAREGQGLTHCCSVMTNDAYGMIWFGFGLE